MQTVIFIGGMATFLGCRAGFHYISWKRAGIDLTAISACYVAIQYLWRFI